MNAHDEIPNSDPTRGNKGIEAAVNRGLAVAMLKGVAAGARFSQPGATPRVRLEVINRSARRCGRLALARCNGRYAPGSPTNAAP